MIKVKANPMNIASVLTERKGIQFKAQDVRNVISNIKRSEEVVITAEESLEEVINSGGDVRYRKQDGNDNVEVLWIQTKEMRYQLKRCSPLLFECDTTFGTQVEGYKLYIPVFFSNFTGRWEVSGLLFLSTETREKVEAGLEFFRQSLPYSICGKRIIFFMDKDFDYISVRYYRLSHHIIYIIHRFLKKSLKNV